MPGPLQPRVSWAALWAYANGRGITTMTVLSERCGVNIRDLHRYRKAGELGERAADRIAVGLGDVPDTIWGEEYAEATAGMVAKAEAAEAAERAAAEVKAAKLRARNAASKRRQRAGNLARERARVEAWKRANLAHHHRYQAEYRERNRERIAAHARAKYRERREGLHLHGHPGQESGQGKTKFRNEEPFRCAGEQAS